LQVINLSRIIHQNTLFSLLHWPQKALSGLRKPLDFFTLYVQKGGVSIKYLGTVMGFDYKQKHHS